jgi:hypothetical protein
MATLQPPQPQVYQMSDESQKNQLAPSVPLFQPREPGIHKYETLKT